MLLPVSYTHLDVYKRQGEEVNVTGFGAWKISNRAARNGVNPKTGAKIQIAAMKTPVFRAGKTLKEAVR